MFAVPEADDDTVISTPVEAIKPITQPEATKESSPPPSPAAPSIEQVPIKIPVPPPVVPTKQHRSRRSLFHRNTIHICDQIVDRV
jgi:hypothetical protein